MSRLDRRRFLTTSAAGAVSLPLLYSARATADDDKILPVAGVTTVYRRNSHADVILGKVIAGYDQQGGPGPKLRLVSIFTDQVPSGDMSRSLSKEHGFRIAESIDEALTLGGEKLAVAGVLLVGEHGTYPFTPDTNQHMYPRRRLFDGIIKTFQRCGQVVPVFNDKHLAYRFSDARHMYDTAREMKIPFLAGSSVPVAWRKPPLVLPRDCEIEEAMAVGYGGRESYGFHALESLQCMIERRRGGETGVASVQAVEGDGIWQAEREGRWSRKLLEAAVARTPGAKPGKIEDRLTERAAFYLVEYRDGLKATVAMATGVARQFAFAAQLKDETAPRSTWFQLQDGAPYAHFGHLVRAIERLIHTGRPPYPVERTLLTTGVLDSAMHSLAEENRRRKTPELKIAYQPTDWPPAEGEVPPPRS